MEKELANGEILNAFLTTSAGIFIFSLVILWSSVWKAIALWKAARRGDTPWYVILLVLNTIGILEIIYIFAVCKSKKK